MIRLAHKMATMLPRVNADDLQSIGSEALVKAALRFDPESSTPFESFAFYRVRGAMIDGARAEDRGHRQHRRAELALQRSQELLEQSSKDELAQANAGEDLRTLTERVAAAKRLVEKTAAIAMMSRTRVSDVDSVSSSSTRKGSSSAESVLLHEEQLERLRGVVASLPEEQRALVTTVYLEGGSLTEHAKKVGKSLATISRRHSKLLGVLADRLRDG
jgi:RNA polymerase sigma factor for flagellar operon FliA